MHRLAALACLLTSTLCLADFTELTLEEFKVYQHYKNAMEDPRVQKMKPEARVPAIAKDAGYKLKDLQAAIAKGEAAGDVKGKCEAAIREALSGSELAGRVGTVDVDTSDPHAVGYVQWLNESPEKLEIEACTSAALVQKSCPILSTVQVWAQDNANPKARVFQALISGSAAAKIKPDRIKDFASTRYMRLFEKVKSVAAGDDLSQESGTPAGKANAN